MMDTSCRKNKKRKTRKLLNEMRNRSKNKSVTGKHKHNSCGIKITRDRLTLKRGIFAKSVRSETVTRQPISEEYQARLDENLHKIIDLANRKNTEKPTKPTLSTLCQPGTSSPKHVPDEEVSPLHFSPGKNHSLENQEKYTSLSTSDVDSSTDEFHYQLYREFSDEVPLYLNQYVPNLMKDNVMKKTKDFLQSVYKESCQRESENNILDCIRKTNKPKLGSKEKSLVKEAMEESVLLNPIQYLKKGYLQERIDGNPSKCKNELEADTKLGSKESSVKYVIFSSDEDLDTGGTYSDNSSRNNSQKNKESSTENIIKLINESPECVYYPRKLN